MRGACGEHAATPGDLVVVDRRTRGIVPATGRGSRSADRYGDSFFFRFARFASMKRRRSST